MRIREAKKMGFTRILVRQEDVDIRLRVMFYFFMFRGLVLCCIAVMFHI